MNREQVLEFIEQIARFGQQEIGTTRLAFSHADREARQYITERMQQLGLVVRVDEAGNIIGRLTSPEIDNKPAVATGSHLDTVPNGGKYDGVVGVVAGLAAVERLRHKGPLSHPVELIVFAAEESSRFGLANFGSKAMAGLLNLSPWLKRQDAQDITLAEALVAAGIDKRTIKQAVRSSSALKCFVELHIEQGSLLEQGGKTLGLVEKIAAPTRCKLIVEGRAAHSGTTPMDERQDALVSAAMIILAVQEIALEQSGMGTVATVGTVKVHPGAMNVVPGLVELGLDIRGVEQSSLVEALQDIKDAVSTIAEAQETAVSIEVLSSEKPVLLDTELTAAAEDICQRFSISYQRMHSGAGHDAMYMAHIVPSALLFIPCRAGISHNAEEQAEGEDIMKGVDVLTEMLYNQAK